MSQRFLRLVLSQTKLAQDRLRLRAVWLLVENFIDQTPGLGEFPPSEAAAGQEEAEEQLRGLFADQLREEGGRLGRPLAPQIDQGQIELLLPPGNAERVSRSAEPGRQR